MQYIIKRGNRYYYQRRIPTPVLEFTDSTYLKISLKTDSKELAKRRCARLNAEVESYWKGLIDKEQPRDHQHFKENINLAKIIGFNYQPIEQVGNLPSQELIERLQFAKEHQSMYNVIDTLLGTVKQPEITISRALDIFWPITKDRLIGKSSEQIRRWRNPRLKAVRNFTKVCGDLSIEAVGRNEIVKFKDWWLFRIEEEGVKASTANKDITHIKGILETVSDHLQLDLDIHKIFRKTQFPENKEHVSRSFETRYIKDVLLKPNAFKGLNNEARDIALVMVNTGARPSEITGLEPEDICLDHDIPHIIIRPNKTRSLKSVYSRRVIPLLGCSLKAMQNYPNGFIRYKNKTSSFSTYINDVMRKRGLLPSEDHTLYSLRHSFQNRLNHAEVKDRMDVELMGHKFNRPKYGEGPTLEQKYECLKDISF